MTATLDNLELPADPDGATPPTPHRLARPGDATLDESFTAASEGDTVTDSSEPAGDAPVAIRIEKGNPTDLEVAALVAVLSAAAAAGSAAPVADSRPPELWGRPTLMHRGITSYAPYAYPYMSHIRE